MIAMRMVVFLALIATLVGCPTGGSKPLVSHAQVSSAAVFASENPDSTLPLDLPPNPTQSDADIFAWKTFVALNRPALPGRRGVPDPGRKIGEPGPVVWETWKSPDEIFYPDGRQPPGWEQYGGEVPPACRQTGTPGPAAGDLILSSTSKAPDGIANDALRLAKQAVGGTLTDQNRNLVRYEIRMNRTIFEDIVVKGYYNAEQQDKARSIQFPTEVMEIKAAWREITDRDGAEIRKRFYRRIALIYTPASDGNPASCVKREVGLIGLHITHKTPSRPQWIWATFEQVDNVPPFESAPPPGRQLPYSFNNPGCLPQMCPPNRSTEKNGKPSGIPTQVTRVVNVGEDARKINPVWQQLLAREVKDSPFQYYQLVDVQWPQAPAQRPAGNPTPGLVANTSMETYVPESSCINCHFTARTLSGRLSSDYSFMLTQAHAPKRR